MKNSNWFEVDRDGLAQLLGERGPAALILELIANAWDALGVRHVRVLLNPIPNKPYALVQVDDDSPEGFSDLRHAYTLFAASAKRSDPTRRGRFNVGEKLVLSLCREAEIVSVNDSIRFDSNGRYPSKSRTTRGTRFTGEMRMTRAQVDEAVRLFKRLIPPENILTTFLVPDEEFSLCRVGMPVPTVVEATLDTVLSDGEGLVRKTRRKTEVSIWPVRNVGEPGWVYELGIPVVEIGGEYDVDVSQKVPLNMERDNVSHAYRRALHAIVLEVNASELSAEAAGDTWVTEALPLVGDETLGVLLDKRFGAKRVSFDPSDPEANALAASKGYTVVHGGSLSRDTWSRARESGAIVPAGQVTPSRGVEFSADGRDVSVARDKWPTGAHELVPALGFLALRLLGHAIAITLVNDPRGYAACYSAEASALTLNVRRLGRAWFEHTGALRPEHVDLLLHELGHEFESNHFDAKYHEALTRLGAKLAFVVLEIPSILKIHGV